MTTATPQVLSSTGLGQEAVNGDLLAAVGYVPDGAAAATSLMVDHHFATVHSRNDDVVTMPIQDAIVTYPWLQDLMFSLITSDENEILHQAFDTIHRPLGTFTWVKPGAKLTEPLQSFTVMSVPHSRQFVHDVTVIGEGAEVEMISGSAVTPELTHGRHVSMSETFIGKNAKVRSLSIDRWAPKMEVYTFSATTIADGASNSTVSVAVSPVETHTSQSYTEVGAGAVDATHAVVLAPENTHREMSTKIVLKGTGARAENIARMVSSGGHIFNVTDLVGEGSQCSGFLECDGLLISPDGSIDSVPALRARTDDAKLSHEANVGMIDQRKLDYLMAAGMDEDASRDLIVRGFLELDRHKLPESVREKVDTLVAAAREAEL